MSETPTTPEAGSEESSYKHVIPNFNPPADEPAKPGLDSIVDEVEGKQPKAAQPKKKASASGAQNPTAPKAEPLKPSPQEELYEIKVNGKVMKLPLKDIIARAQLTEASQERFSEASKQRKHVEKIISTARSNPIQALMDPALGLSKEQIRDAFEEWYAREYIDPEHMTPEQLRLRDAEAKIKAYEEAEQAAKQRAEQEEQEKLTAAETANLQKTIIEAMESSGLPKTKFFVERMAFYMRQNLLNGWDAPINVIVAQVRKERQAIMSDLTESSDPETLIAMLGEGIVNKIRQHDLKKLREKRARTFSVPSDSAESSQSSSDEKVDYAEVKRAMRRQWGI